MKDALLLGLLAGALGAADFRAGVARIDITPDGPIWMSGYASRAKPSAGVLQKLSAKALAVEDAKKRRVVFVTTDVIGLPRAMTDVVAARVQKAHGLDRAAVLKSVAKTGRLLIADEDYLGFGLTGEISAIVAENLDTLALKAPVKRLAVPNVPIPYSRPLEQFVIPQVAGIVDAARALVKARVAERAAA